MYSYLGYVTGTIKSSAYGDYFGLATQRTLPIQDRRKLDKSDRKAIEEGKSRWLPRIFQSHGTPVTELMASPGKQALLWSLLGGGVGAGAGGLVGGSLGNALTNNLSGVGAGAGIGALAGGLGLGGLTGLLAYHGRKAKNEDLEEMITRLPKNPKKRDLYSDPVYFERGSDTAGNPSSGSLLAAVLNGMANSRISINGRPSFSARGY